MKTKLLALATVAAIAVGVATPASAHGFGVNFNIGIPFAPYVYGAPVYAPPAYGPWYYAPSAPTIVVPTPYPVQPDPIIRQTQHALNVLGYGPLNEDGIAGFKTTQAVMAFQARNGLAVDGIVGTGTMAVISAQMRAFAPPPPAKEAPARNTTEGRAS